tara:strand:+ start:1044 stop:1568 length:525 start_codon:yes stop_codon:yes gene_type:complete
MAGSLIKIAETTVSSAVASVTLGASDWDSSYDVYLVKFNNVSPSTAEQMKARFLESGTENSTSNYDYAAKHFRTSGAFENLYGTNATSMTVASAQIHASTGNANGCLYIFNANNASEYTFITTETTIWAGSSQVAGDSGGNVFTSASAVNGIKFFINSSHNIDSGTFVLYGLKK